MKEPKYGIVYLQISNVQYLLIILKALLINGKDQAVHAVIAFYVLNMYSNVKVGIS
jgi:hypothetical protein